MDHAIAERRSLAYHREIAERIERDASILQRARARVATWLADGSVAEHYARGWHDILVQPDTAIRAFLVEASERADAFRQVSPFAGALTPRERWALWASVPSATMTRQQLETSQVVTRIGEQQARCAIEVSHIS